MTTTKVKSAAKTAAKTAGKGTRSASKAAGKVPAPARAIGDAAVDLERDIVAALRKELKNLKKMIGTIQHDVQTALSRVEDALEAAAETPPSANGKGAAKKTGPKTAKKATASRSK